MRHAIRLQLSVVAVATPHTGRARLIRMPIPMPVGGSTRLARDQVAELPTKRVGPRLAEMHPTVVGWLKVQRLRKVAACLVNLLSRRETEVNDVLDDEAVR